MLCVQRKHLKGTVHPQKWNFDPFSSSGEIFEPMPPVRTAPPSDNTKKARADQVFKRRLVFDLENFWNWAGEHQGDATQQARRVCVFTFVILLTTCARC